MAVEQAITEGDAPAGGSILKNKDGWDGKLRVPKKAIVVQDEGSDQDDSEDEAVPREVIEADEGEAARVTPSHRLTRTDLLEDEPSDADDIDLVHRGVSSIEALKLGRFKDLQRLCLRQNFVSKINIPDSVGETLVELDLYDNLISHIRGLENTPHLTNLDLSFNKLKHIKNINHLKDLKELFFVQNRISRIENLEGLSKIKYLELAANRIRTIENLETLTGIEQLWLGKNKISTIDNLSPLQSLRVLSIQANRISSLSGLESLSNLEELYVSFNALHEISGLQNNKKLRVLDISDNQIEHLEGLEELSQLEEFWASTNKLASFAEVEKQLADKENLETVYFEGNPLQTQAPVVYRNKVRLALPQVKQIDATYVKV